MIRKTSMWAALLLALPYLLHANHDALLEILQDELQREQQAFAEQDTPPYYMDYRVDDVTSFNLVSSFGSLTRNQDSRSRLFTLMLRVGDYTFDNTHDFKGNYSNSEQMEVYGATLPIEDEPEAIKQVIWRLSDKAYRNASGTYASHASNPAWKEEKSALPDFSEEPVVNYFEETLPKEALAFDADVWSRRLKEYTSFFATDSLVFHSEASLRFTTQRRYFVSTEKSSIVQNQQYCQVQFMVSIQHKEGTVLPLQHSYTATSPAGLPDHNRMMADMNTLYQTLKQLRDAPMAEPYAGPAILSPAAAGVFFHEIFGHRIEGHRLESSDDGQTFKDKVGSQVLPKNFQVYSDPGLKQFQDQDLIGHYKFDDQGVAGSRVVVVEEGRLNEFLMSRRPTQEFARSNGHGRAQPGFAPVSRQSNLIIETTNGLNDEELRKMLIKECKKQKKEYGYYFKEVIGGLTYTDRYNANVFNVNPTEVYRIYVDGRPDEIVTGVDLIGTPLTMFSNIQAGGDTQDVFTGFCGAESGYVPVTTIAPSVFVKKIETQKTPEFDSKLPLLPPPEKSLKKE